VVIGYTLLAVEAVIVLWSLFGIIVLFVAGGD
jgi:hypothetical protein